MKYAKCIAAVIAVASVNAFAVDQKENFKANTDAKQAAGKAATIVGRAAVGTAIGGTLGGAIAGGPVGVGLGIIFSPSKIGCGQGEQCSK